MVQQPRVKTSQRFAAGEDEIGGELRLVDHPVVTERTAPGLSQQRIHLADQTMENLGPPLARKPIGKSLGRFGVIQRNEGIVLLGESQPPLQHLLSQPGMTVDANLGSEREPSGEPDVNQAQIRIKEIKVQDALLSPR